MNHSLLKLAVLVLGLVLVMCVGGIIYLAAVVPARAIPDILVATVAGIVGTIGGILVPRSTSD